MEVIVMDIHFNNDFGRADKIVASKVNAYTLAQKTHGISEDLWHSNRLDIKFNNSVLNKNRKTVPYRTDDVIYLGTKH